MTAGTFNERIYIECHIDGTSGVVTYVDLSGNNVRFPSHIAKRLRKIFQSLNKNDVELIVDVSVDWYHTPARLYLDDGSPGYPEEGGEERVVLNIWADDLILETDLINKLETLLEAVIEGHEFDRELYEESKKRYRR